MIKEVVNVAIAIAVILTLLAGYFLVKVLWLEPFVPAKFGFNFNDENTKRLNEDNRAYLARLMKKCNLQVYTEDYYVNSDTQLIGMVTSIELGDDRVKLGVGGRSEFNLANNLTVNKSLQRLDAKNNLIDEITLDEFSVREILKTLIPGNWIRIDKGSSKGPSALIVYCHE